MCSCQAACTSHQFSGNVFLQLPPFLSSGPAAARGSSLAVAGFSRPCPGRAGTCRGLGGEGQRAPRPRLRARARALRAGTQRPLPQPQPPRPRRLPAAHLPTLHLPDPGPISWPLRPRVPRSARAPCCPVDVTALCSSPDCGGTWGQFLVDERMMGAALAEEAAGEPLLFLARLGPPAAPAPGKGTSGGTRCSDAPRWEGEAAPTPAPRHTADCFSGELVRGACHCTFSNNIQLFQFNGILSC